METILVVNAGSSSVKFQIFEIKKSRTLGRLIKGQIDGIGTNARLRVVGPDAANLADQSFAPSEVPDVGGALKRAGDWLHNNQNLKPVAIGHRVVHGGPDNDRPIIVDEAAVNQLERYVPLAPLHQPHNLAAIRSLLVSNSPAIQVACFDTAFHRTQTLLTDHYALPEALYIEGVRRYGFHGLSYEYIADRLREVAPEVAHRRVIVAHLGSGASMCALLDGRSIETTMGFTALDGLPMGTRPGQLDPGVLLYLIIQKNMTPTAVQNLLYRESGLKGLSGISSDMRELEASVKQEAGFAIDYFSYRVALYTGMLAAALGGLDAFVFTAGIGENSALVRERIINRIAWMGAALDPTADVSRKPLISAPNSRIQLYVIPTDEELMIAKHTLRLLETRSTPAMHR